MENEEHIRKNNKNNIINETEKRFKLLEAMES